MSGKNVFNNFLVMFLGCNILQGMQVGWGEKILEADCFNQDEEWGRVDVLWAELDMKDLLLEYASTVTFELIFRSEDEVMCTCQ